MANPSNRKADLDAVLDIVPSIAKKAGMDEFEVFAYSRSSKRVMVDTNRVSSVTVVGSTGLFVRVIVDKRAGTSFCSSFLPKDVERCIRSAKTTASCNDLDPHWPGFPEPKTRYPEVKGLFDPKLESMELAELTDMMDVMIQGARAVASPISVTLGGVESSLQTTGVMNSSGVRIRRKETAMQAFCVSLWGSGSSVTPEASREVASRSANIDFEGLGRDSAEIALHSSTIADSRTGDSEVIFSSASLGSGDSGLLNIMMQKALSGQSVIRKSSFLSEFLDKEVGPKELTIYDNPLHPGAVGSKEFDDEGTPTKKKTLVSNGVVKGFVWDNYYASRSGRSSTGNAVRDPSTGAVLSSTLNLQVRPGKGSLDDLVSEIHDGYLVWSGQGIHTSNVETGDFSFVVNPGLRIRRGEIVGGLKGVMISGNMLDLLKGLSRIGADVADYGNNLMPSIVFNDVKVTCG